MAISDAVAFQLEYQGTRLLFCDRLCMFDYVADREGPHNVLTILNDAEPLTGDLLQLKGLDRDVCAECTRPLLSPGRI